MYRDVFRRAIDPDDGDAAVFVTMISGDREVPSMIPLEMARALSAASPRPVFGMTRTHLGTGMVGGWLLDPEVVGRRAGELAVRVLQGTPARRIPVEQGDDVFRPVFDARALKRFAIARSTLPAGAEILFDEVAAAAFAVD